MEKVYKYITIESDGEKNGHPCYIISNNVRGEYLGSIWWYTTWKQYVSQRGPHCLFSASCDLDIVDFIKNHAGKEEA